jgi:hypothetical protein
VSRLFFVFPSVARRTDGIQHCGGTPRQTAGKPNQEIDWLADDWSPTCPVCAFSEVGHSVPDSRFVPTDLEKDLVFGLGFEFPNKT